MGIQAALTEQIRQWNIERQRLVATLTDGTDGTGWPLSPEAKDNLRKDIAECDRTLRRYHNLMNQREDEAR